jgi:PAS domain S-box-containing protein
MSNARARTLKPPAKADGAAPAELDRAALFEQSLSLVCIIGFDGYIKRWNPGWGNAFGFTAEEMMAKRLREFVHPDDAVHVAEVTRQIVSGQPAMAVEARIRCKDGSYKWILWNSVPCVEQGVFLTTGQDVTRRKQVEQWLRESQARFELLADATKEAVWDWDLRENRIWRSDGYRQRYGEPDDALETAVVWWRKRIHPLDRERVFASLPPPVVDGRQQWAMEYRLRRVDGTYADVFDRGYVLFDSQGSPVRMLGSLMDVSEQKETERKLRESDERFRLAAKATSDAMWDWEISKGQVWRGDGYQSLFGYRADEIGPNFEWWFERVHPDDREAVTKQMPLPGGSDSQQCAIEYRFRRVDGTYADVFDRGFVMYAADGTPTRMIGVVTDVSERRRAEEVAHMQRAELAHIARVRTMGEIASGLAHELNQPLTAISNYAASCVQALASGSPDSNEKVLAWIEKIAANTDRAGQMIRRLRGFTRKSEPCRSTVEINELVQEVLELMEAETRSQGVKIRWQPTAVVHAAVDRIQVQQVLVNLLHNAYEAMVPLPIAERHAIISSDVVDRMVRLSVEDSGVGIPAEQLPRVFDAFYTNKPNGVGIGLAISRSIVEDHGGRLWVEPNPKQGVTFRFTLPRSGA